MGRPITVRDSITLPSGRVIKDPSNGSLPKGTIDCDGCGLPVRQQLGRIKSCDKKSLPLYCQSCSHAKEPWKIRKKLNFEEEAHGSLSVIEDLGIRIRNKSNTKIRFVRVKCNAGSPKCRYEYDQALPKFREVQRCFECQRFYGWQGSNVRARTGAKQTRQWLPYLKILGYGVNGCEGCGASTKLVVDHLHLYCINDHLETDSCWYCTRLPLCAACNKVHEMEYGNWIASGKSPEDSPRYKTMTTFPFRKYQGGFELPPTLW